MLAAYFDESGTHGGAVVTVAGYLGDTITWARLERPWKNILAKNQIKCFHATDCAMQRREFVGWCPAVSEKMSCELAEAVASERLIAISASVYRDEWNYVIREYPKLAERFGSPYYLCVAMALSAVNKACVEKGDGEFASIVFAQSDEHDSKANFIYEAFKQSPDYPCIGHKSVGLPKYVLPLQIADQLSYETYQEMLTQLHVPGLTAPKREQFKILNRGLFDIDMHASTLAMLHGMAQEVENL